jgi:hypothetical protein
MPPFAPLGPSGRFPSFSAPMWHSDFSPSPPRSALVAPLSSSGVATGKDEISQVPGQPLRTCPDLRPRLGESLRTPGQRPCVSSDPLLPSTFVTASAQQQYPFRGSISRPIRSLSTLRSAPHGNPTQDSLPSGGPPPWPVGTFTRGLQREVLLLHHSSSPRLRLAQNEPGFSCKPEGGRSPTEGLSAANPCS